MSDPLRSPKLRPWHLDRSAFVYVRQSTPQQVSDHQESTARQYALADRAVALGWTADRVTTIDDDLGKSGQSIEGRPGFQRLLAEVALDHVGLILGLEMSRLARSNRDWHQLLELCARFRVLLADAEAVYDPTDHNDRLLLGLHGMMSEAELHILKERMYQGKLNKARRGELLGLPPIGYVRLASGEWAIDPDEQVQATVRLIFDQFDREATLHGLLRYLVHHGIRIPVRPDHGPEPRRTGVAAAEPGDAVEPAAPPELRRGLPVRPPAGRPAAQAARAADHRQADPPAGGLPGADPRPAAGVHHVGPLLRQPGAARGQPGAARPAGRAAARPVAAGRAAAVRAVRPADARAVRGAEESTQLQLHARGGRLRRPAVPEPLRAGARRPGRRSGPRGRRAGGPGGEPGGGGRGRAGAIRADPALATPPRTRPLRGRSCGPPVPGVRAGESPGRTRAGAPLGGGAEGTAAVGGRLRAMAADGPRPAHPRGRAGDPALAADLPAVWQAATTTPAERQRIARLLIEHVRVTVDKASERVDVAIHWAGGPVESHTVSRPVKRYDLQADYPRLVERLRGWCGERLSAAEIAGAAQRGGLPSPEAGRAVHPGDGATPLVAPGPRSPRAARQPRGPGPRRIPPGEPGAGAGRLTGHGQALAPRRLADGAT